jgi:GDP-L-fucose synthase
MTPESNIYVAGHTGLVGSALVRRLESGGYDNLVLRARAELDLTEQAAVREFFLRERPDCVMLAAARVGGILANEIHGAEFIYQNVMIEANILEAAFRAGVKKLLFLASSCVYPKHSPQPMKEECLMTGPLEPTNEPYAIAKIAGIKMCAAYNRQFGTNYICAVPATVYGPGDNYDERDSHVLPALIRKMHHAVERGEGEVVVWGSGEPRREFVYVDDLADACVFLMERCGAGTLGEFVNVGTGVDTSIRELAEMTAEIVGFRGRLVFDRSKPDGTPQKLLDSSRMRSQGWTPRVGLVEGVRRTYEWFVKHAAIR